MITATLLLALSHLVLSVSGLAALCPLFPAEHDRFGINVAILYGKDIDDYATQPLNLGWYIDYSTRTAPSEPHGAQFWQLMYASGNYPVDEMRIGALVEANPGAVWVLGNEPDRVLLQDSKTPTEYARFYHDAYTVIKAYDPYARVATAGIVQPTPIRLRYLDAVLAEYKRLYHRPMPVDIWTVHNFILREVEDEWGAEIPPGMEAYAAEGKRYTVIDHGRMDIFQQQIRDFRAWMARQGYRNKPLVVTEYGILMPKEYGFDEEVVQKFMLESFDFMRNTRDADVGYPLDDHRLVQGWGWFSLNDKEFDMKTFVGFNGNLFDHDNGVMSAFGQTFGAYTAPLTTRFADTKLAGVEVSPSYLIEATTEVITLSVTLVNGGNLPSGAVDVTLWAGAPDDTGSRLGTQTVQSVRSHCRERVSLQFAYEVAALPAGRHDLALTLVPAGAGGPTTSEPLIVSIYMLAEQMTVERLYMPSLQVVP